MYDYTCRTRHSTKGGMECSSDGSPGWVRACHWSSTSYHRTKVSARDILESQHCNTSQVSIKVLWCFYVTDDQVLIFNTCQALQGRKLSNLKIKYPLHASMTFFLSYMKNYFTFIEWEINYRNERRLATKIFTPRNICRIFWWNKSAGLFHWLSRILEEKSEK